MSNTPSLLPCPFCGGINIIHCGHHMYCHACGADGPDADSQHESEARSAWNRRTPQPVVRESSEDLYWELHGLSKILEGSGLIDESRNPDAYTTILDAMAFVRGAQPVVREPLTDEQIQDLLLCGNPTDEEMRLIRIGWDAAHDIKGGQYVGKVD